MFQILSGDRGVDLIKTRERAKQKILTKDEYIAALTEQEALLQTFDRSPAELENIKVPEASKMRNVLMSVASLRLGTRSKELVSMTIDEVKRAKTQLVDEEEYKIIEVVDHKNTKSGIEAGIAYKNSEYRILGKYIKYVRRKLNDAQSKYSYLQPRRVMLTRQWK